MSTTDFMHHESRAVAGRPSRIRTFATNAMLAYVSVWPPVVIFAVIPWLTGRPSAVSVNFLSVVAANVDAIMFSLLFAAISFLFPRRRVLTYFGFLLAIEVVPLLFWGWGPGPHPVGVYGPICLVVFALALTGSFAVVVRLFERFVVARHGQAS
jgi:hypothetical protein